MIIDLYDTVPTPLVYLYISFIVFAPNYDFCRSPSSTGWISTAWSDLLTDQVTKKQKLFFMTASSNPI